eukprot:CAMPEP_0203774170 /NCGR_PEP_ID=MMETSP0099_2-20121227/5128_1 /ASSEMBLY_ACC=CAM_ASM_000209 /TAXON_ID=96639 /ORGANISM=" , Strain NY0313808BC1" /LENGTH=196 /DNA_ID=CAMNT_0050672209 /DNA_START=255 /DNA_END=845 /DNA_ORIENTATION=+
MERSFLVLACLFASICSSFGTTMFAPPASPGQLGHAPAGTDLFALVDLSGVDGQQESWVQFQSRSYFTICEVEVYDINGQRIFPIGHYSTEMYYGTKASYAYDGDYSNNWERCAHLDNKGSTNGNTILRLRFQYHQHPAKVVVYSRIDANINNQVLWDRLTNVKVYIFGPDNKLVDVGNLDANPAKKELPQYQVDK